MRLMLIAAAAAILLSGCGDRAKLEVTEGIGPDPRLPQPVKTLFPTVNIVIGWLFLRAVALGVTSAQVHESGIRRWTIIAAGTDFALGLIMLIGLSLSTAVVLIFGPTPEIVASFAWVLALSFVATGTLLLEVASCEREAAS